MAAIVTFRNLDHRDHNYHRCSSYSGSEVNSPDDSDSVDSCFVGQEEEFYSSTLTPPTPSEDIWKKFELYPTPPLSPSHPDDEKGKDLDLNLHDDEAELLQEVTNILMDDDDLPWMERKCHFSDPVFRAPSPVSPALIQDCMWSSIIAEERRKFFMKTEKKPTEDKSKKTTPPPSNSAMMLPPLVPASEYGSSDCVDPSAVFPYPLSETRLDLFGTGTNTPSDSEEEIDVVTVEKKHSAHHHHKSHTTRPYHRHQTTKPRPVHHQQPVNITLLGKRGRTSNATILSIPIKKLKTEGNLEEVKQMLQKSNIVRSSGHSRGSSRGSSRNSSRPSSQPGSHPSSDSEDTEKRACHNVLERKRREDLRTSFLMLRDEVPELGSSERAAKVVILKKATDYVTSLKDQEESLQMELETEKRRNIQLMRTLESMLSPRPL